jgi:hypothetical protein
MDNGHDKTTNGRNEYTLYYKCDDAAALIVPPSSLAANLISAGRIPYPFHMQFLVGMSGRGTLISLRMGVHITPRSDRVTSIVGLSGTVRATLPAFVEAFPKFQEA